MAKQVTVRLVDDMNPAESADESVTFGLDGNQYEIDLSEKNAAKLRANLGPFIDAARKVSGTSRKTQKRIAREDLDKIREWAKAHGHKVADRGRISLPVMDEYDRAQKQPAQQPQANAGAPEDTTVSRVRKPKKDAEGNDVKAPAFSG